MDFVRRLCASGPSAFVSGRLVSSIKPFGDFEECIASLDPALGVRMRHAIQKIKGGSRDSLYNIAITGGIGVGKSLRCEAIYNILKLAELEVYNQPEYIDTSEIGREMLENMIKGRISPLTFQNYVMDEWARRDMIHTSGVQIFERTPDECTMVFASILRKPNSSVHGFVVDPESYSAFASRTRRLNEMQGCPSWCDSETRHDIVVSSGDIVTNLLRILEIMAEDILEGHTMRRIIYLSLDLDETLRRIFEYRSREEESSYDVEYLTALLDNYKKLVVRAPLPRDWIAAMDLDLTEEEEIQFKTLVSSN